MNINNNNKITENQAFPPSPLRTRTRKRKDPEDSFLSFIDQGPNGYSSSKLVRSAPRRTSDSYFIVKTFKSEVRSYRRNYSHRSVALYRTKKDGPTRVNIEFLTCSFLELDGANDSTVKSLKDVTTLISKHNLAAPSYVIETSKGHFHVLWTYNDPLPWTESGESFWISQQSRLIELFRNSGFNVDVGASLNPCQNLRNPSELSPHNFKRGCPVKIHRTFAKTSLRRLYRALNATNIPNPSPKRLPASTRLRRDWRATKTFITTQKALAKKHGVSERTIRRELQKAIQNGDLQIVRKVGNNKQVTRATEYISNLYLSPNSQNGHISISENNSLPVDSLLRDFKQKGASIGRRNKTVFVLAVGLSCKSKKTASVAEIADHLKGGAMLSGLSEKELIRTIKSAVKPVYSNPFSLAKMRQWDLLEGPEHSRKSLLH